MVITFIHDIMSTYSYEEFHPFLFAQHAKSPYVEFDTFDKVNHLFFVLFWGRIFIYFSVGM